MCVPSVWAGEDAVYVRRTDPFLTVIDATTAAVTHIVTAPLDGGGDVIRVDNLLWTSDPDSGVVVGLAWPPRS